METVKKYLLENEKVIMSNDIFTLTNFRLIKSVKNQIIFIPLEKISSIELLTKIKLLYIALGAVLISIGFGFSQATYNNNNQQLAGTIMIIIGIILIIVFLVTIKHFLIITSDGGTSIKEKTNGIKKENLYDFIKEIQLAINNRFELKIK